MNIEKALKCTCPKQALKNAKEAETRNCEQHVIRALYTLYYKLAEQ